MCFFCLMQLHVWLPKGDYDGMPFVLSAWFRKCFFANLKRCILELPGARRRRTSRLKYPELRERLKKAAEDPMIHKLETLLRPEPKKTRGRGRGRGAGRQEKPKSTSEAILRDAACAAASGPAVRLQPGPRALKERTSAEDWLFGPHPDRGRALEVAVLDDLKAVPAAALSAFFFPRRPSSNFGAKCVFHCPQKAFSNESR